LSLTLRIPHSIILIETFIETGMDMIYVRKPYAKL